MVFIPELMSRVSNFRVHDVTEESPFKMLFGREPTLPVDIALPTIGEPWFYDVGQRISDMQAAAQCRIERHWNYVHATNDHPEVEYHPGEYVLVSYQAGKCRKASKLLSRFYGPYRVISKTSPVNYEVETRGKRWKATFLTHVSQMKRFYARNEMYVDSKSDDGESLRSDKATSTD